MNEESVKSEKMFFQEANKGLPFSESQTCFPAKNKKQFQTKMF